MSFSVEFLKHFSIEESNSKMVQITASIGDLMEKAIKEDITAALKTATDVNLFSLDRIHSWLAFLRSKVRNRVATQGVAQVTCTGLASGETVTVPADAKMLTTRGVVMNQRQSIVFSNNQTKAVAFTNAVKKTYEAVYDEFILIESEAVTLDGLKITLDGVDINALSDYLDDYSAYNGYFATYFNGSLYIKIYAGSSSDGRRLTAHPQGRQVTVEYYECDGVIGNIDQDSITGYQDSYLGSGGVNQAVFQITNGPLSSGADRPTRPELINQLRRVLFVQRSVSSVLEYTAWFLARPEIGDVLVRTDEQKYLEWISLGGEPTDFTPAAE